ncbi:hypothetical protein EH228_18735 [Erwinia endophytica]|uniref:hypothetical protein n=1 Tax=Erwinia endophytica TaxID=1563158 RepID=UPI001265E9CC|nr:hypothetical protein [Erwinia endophytica]KAB8306313.1 hypothetical protein EH228_18735 [Erwinia endophytica]
MKKLLMTLLPTSYPLLATSPLPSDIRLTVLFAPLLMLFRNENRSLPDAKNSPLSQLNGCDSNNVHGKPLLPELRNGGTACTFINVLQERANRGDV